MEISLIKIKHLLDEANNLDIYDPYDDCWIFPETVDPDGLLGEPEDMVIDIGVKELLKEDFENVKQIADYIELTDGYRIKFFKRINLLK